MKGLAFSMAFPHLDIRSLCVFFDLIPLCCTLLLAPGSKGRRPLLKWLITMVDREEQYVLRVQDKAVAARIRKQLNMDNSKAKLDARFDASHSDGRTGQFSFGSESLPVTLLDLPCVVESYKTYDDSHLIKTGDIGQMLLVQPEGSSHPEIVESSNGITPAMRNARKRHFNSAHVDHQEVQAVEDDLLQLASGRAPQNMLIEDIEEEYKVDEQGNGSWQPVEKKAAPKVLLNVKGDSGKTKRKKAAKKPPPDVEQL